MIPSNPFILSLLFIISGIALFFIGKKSHPVKWWLVLLSFGVFLRYLYWRYTYTLNLADFPSTLISVTVLCAEVYGFFAILFFYFQVAGPRPSNQTPPKRTSDPTVDVFVTIYNEPVDILYRTLVGCNALVYPEGKKAVYVLDDGQRPEVRQVAEELNCRYITRSDNVHAKAGSLNNALKFSSGDLVLNFDSDHVPVSSFLEECIGFFEDEKVAFVQTPHHFYNPDPYQRNLKLEKEIIHEQDLFFQVIQPGRNSANSSFYCGSGAIFRRSALEEIGGFITKSVTEDIHTSIRLHAKGYRSIYYRKKLAAGLSPESFSSYLRQRQRWARGHAQIFLSRENPLIIRGLSFAQRINYFASIYYFFLGIPRVIFLIAPLFYLLLGIPPILAEFSTLLHYFFSQYIVAVMAFHLVSGRFRNPFWSDVYETVMSFYLAATALATLFLPKRFFFAVTPKGQQFPKASLNIYWSLPQWTAGFLLIAGLVFGFYSALTTEVIFGAFWISVFWSVYNLLLIVASIITAREQPQRRTKPRLARQVSCELLLPNGQSLSTKTMDLSETGLSLILDNPTYLPAELNVGLESEFGETSFLKGRVVRYERVEGDNPTVAIHFLEPIGRDRQSLIRHMYSGPDSWEGEKQEISVGAFRAFLLLLTSWRAFASEKILRRSTLRRSVKRHCEFLVGEETISGVSQDLSLNGALVKAQKGSLTLPSEFYFKIYWDEENFIVLKAEAAWQQPSLSGSCLIGIRFLNPEREEIETLRKRLYSREIK